MKLKVLLLEDNPSDVEFIKRELHNAGREVLYQVTDNREEYENGIWRFQPHVVLSDHTLPEFNSSEALHIYNKYKEKLDEPTAFILITGSVSEEFAVKKMMEGADDYILKDRMHRLPMAIDQALNKNASILERNKAIQEQGKLLNHINLLLRSTKDGIYEIDEKGLCTFINEAALRMFGYKKEQCIGVNMHKLVHYKKFNHRHYPETECPIYNHTLRNESCRVDNEVFWRSDGSYFHAEYHSSPIIEEGISKGSVVVFVDITEKVIEQRRKDLAYSLNKIFDEEDELDKCLAYLIKEICIGETKDAGEVWITDIGKKELRLGAHFSNSGSLNLNNIQLIFKIGEGFVGHALKAKNYLFSSDVQSDNRYIRKEFGRINNLHSAIAVPIFFKEDIIAVITVYSHKTEEFETPKFLLQKDLLNQIGQCIHRKKTENELSTIFKYSPDMICIAGDDGYFKKVNGAFTEVLGYTEFELLSRPYIDFVYKDDQELTITEAIEITKGKKIFNFHNRYIASDGNVKWLSWTSTPLNVKGLMMGIAKDVTQKLELEKQIEYEKIRQQKVLTEAVLLAEEKERRRIGSELHDNVCQLLGLSSMFIGMAKKQTKDCHNLEEANKLIATAINDIRNLSHELTPVIVNIKSLEESIDELVSNISITTDLVIEFTSGGLDDDSLNHNMKLSLYRIIQEQFNNILKHSQAERVNLHLEQKAGQIKITLLDDGVGFDTKVKSKGIGLLNIDTRVSVLQGTMKIISSPGKGCLLSISIPLIN